MRDLNDLRRILSRRVRGEREDGSKEFLPAQPTAPEPSYAKRPSADASPLPPRDGPGEPDDSFLPDSPAPEQPDAPAADDSFLPE